MKYKCAVIGAGEAGALRKEGNHLWAYDQHDQCELIGVYDVCSDKANKVSAEYGCVNFNSIDELLNQNLEIISVSVHPEERKDVFDRILESQAVRVILCEKPLADTSEDAYQIYHRCQEKNKKLYVNFPRRTNKTYKDLEQKIYQQTYGCLQNVFMTYTRGLWTNASHFIDLALMLFGNPKSVFAQKSPVISPYKKDFNATVLLEYKSFHAQLIGLPSWEDGFYTGDLDLIFDKGRLYVPSTIHYESKDIRYYEVINKRLEEVKHDLSICREENDFKGMVDLIVSDLKSNCSESIDPMDAVFSVKILEAAMISSESGKRVDLNLGV